MLSVLALLAMILVIVPGLSAFAATEVGQPAPALVVQELDGKTFDLSAARGKVVVVSFWATWCPPCRKEMPVLDALYRRYRGQGLEMIGLSADRPHDRSDVTKMMQAFSYPAAMLDDAKVNDFGTPSALAKDDCHRRPWNSSRRADPRSNGGHREESIGSGAAAAAAVVCAARCTPKERLNSQH